MLYNVYNQFRSIINTRLIIHNLVEAVQPSIFKNKITTISAAGHELHFQFGHNEVIYE